MKVLLLSLGYSPRILCKAETKYFTIERELMAIVWAVKYFRTIFIWLKIQIDHRLWTTVKQSKDTPFE